MRNTLLAAILALSLHANAQIKEGFVKYKTSLSSSDDGDMAAALLANSSMNIYFKNDRSLTEMVTPVYSMRTLTDSKGILMLMDGAGEKIFTRTTQELSAKTKSITKGIEPVINVTTEKKKILGYDCTKAFVIMKDSKGNTSTMTIWFTDKITCPVATGFASDEVCKKLKGLPLEINLDNGPLKSRMTAVELSVKPVAETVFTLSTAGYTEKKPNAIREKN